MTVIKSELNFYVRPSPELRFPTLNVIYYHMSQTQQVLPHPSALSEHLGEYQAWISISFHFVHL